MALAHHRVKSGNILFSVVLNAIITIAEFVGGFMANSLALVSDAVHNLSDTLAIAFSYAALKISSKDANYRKTFGYKRFEIIAAFINSLILVGVSVYLFWEAYKRFLNPEPVATGLMLTVAIIGFAANLLSILLLHRDSAHNLNVKAAFLHLLGDTLSSAGVVAGALIMHYFALHWFDPLITVIIGVVIIWNGRLVLKESFDILMQGTPQEINIHKVKQAIETFEQVHNVHHVHSWRLNDDEIHFECHLDLVKDLKVSDADRLRKAIETLLRESFGVQHTTIQIERGSCTSPKTIAGKSSNPVSE